MPIFSAAPVKWCGLKVTRGPHDGSMLSHCAPPLKATSLRCTRERVLLLMVLRPPYCGSQTIIITDAAAYNTPATNIATKPGPIPTRAQTCSSAGPSKIAKTVGGAKTATTSRIKTVVLRVAIQKQGSISKVAAIV